MVLAMKSLGVECSKRVARLNELAEDAESSLTLQKKCDGLPLALASVADYFRFETMGHPTIVECQRLCNKLGSFLHKILTKGGNQTKPLKIFDVCS